MNTGIGLHHTKDIENICILIDCLYEKVKYFFAFWEGFFKAYFACSLFWLWLCIGYNNDTLQRNMYRIHLSPGRLCGFDPNCVTTKDDKSCVILLVRVEGISCPITGATHSHAQLGILNKIKGFIVCIGLHVFLYFFSTNLLNMKKF